VESDEGRTVESGVMVDELLRACFLEAKSGEACLSLTPVERHKKPAPREGVYFQQNTTSRPGQLDYQIQESAKALYLKLQTAYWFLPSFFGGVRDQVQIQFTFSQFEVTRVYINHHLSSD
jgi:hypothetical protein